MKKITPLLFAVSMSIITFSQSLETNILPDSLSIDSGNEYCSNDNTAFVLAHSGSYYQGNHYLLKIENDNYEFINNTPYPLVVEQQTSSSWYYKTNTRAMKIFDGDFYHLTKYNGITIYKQDGTWDSLTYNGERIIAEALLKDNEKFYVIAADLLFYDGTNWSQHTIPTSVSNKYTNVKKYGDKIYFNNYQSGLYSFDGTSVNQIIDHPIYYYEIINDTIWSVDNRELFAFDMQGNAIDLGFNYSTYSSTAPLLIQKNDSLFVFSNGGGNNRMTLIEQGEIVQVQHNLNNNYFISDNRLCLYKEGFLLLSSDHELIYYQYSEYEDFASLQIEKTYRNLDINQVDAYYMHRGQMFWDGIGMPAYEVPKGSGKTSTFTGALWLSALDASDNVHVAAAKFNSNGHDYFPGPLRENGVNKGTTDTTYARNFDHIWKITREEILLHQINYENENYEIPNDIATWPAHGSTSEGYAENLAPFIDTDANGIYEPHNGDYPDIKGDMSLYWIFNDNLAVHGETGGTALGVEVHMQAYAYTCDELTGVDTILNYTTFLDYKIINRSDTSYHNCFSAFWTDADLGSAMDDYVGCNVGLNTMYFYNGDDFDGDGNLNTYGENPPAQLITILEAPLAPENDFIDNDNDGTIDEAGEKALLSSMIYFENNSGNAGDPVLAPQYHNYMQAIWKDNREMVFGGMGYNPSGPSSTHPRAKYMFPGESDPWNNGTLGVDPNYVGEGGWTEENENNIPSDKRGLMSSGPFNLNSGDELKFTLAFVWSRGDNGAFSSVTKGFADVARIIEMHDNGELHGCGLEDISVKGINKNNDLIEIYPNPATDSFVINATDKNSKYQIIDINGQLVDEGILDQKSINVSLLKKGIYNIKIISGDTVNSSKFVKN